MVEMHLAAVRVELPTNTPVVLLQESGGRRALPIYVGTSEATAIAYALQGLATPRPMTHDLMRDLLEAVGVDVERIVITELHESTYYAEIVLRHGGETYSVSSRPSDAMALAVRTGTPIYAEDDLIEQESVLLEVEEVSDDTNPEELVVQFQQFLKDVRPEDFSSES